MNFKGIISIGSFLLMFSVFHSEVVTQSTTREVENSKAKVVWEKAVTAKGGHNRLFGIDSVSVVETIQKRGQPFVQGSSLTVFGRGTWHWVDLRPSRFGVVVDLYDYENKVYYSTNSDNSPVNRSTIPPEEDVYHQVFGLAPYILETKTIRPVLLSVREERESGDEVDVVRTAWPGIEGHFIDFWFSRRTGLPSRAIFVRSLAGQEINEVTMILSNYRDVDGIPMPSTIVVNGERRAVDVGVNVRVAKDFFSTTPTIAAGPRAWSR